MGQEEIFYKLVLVDTVKNYLDEHRKNLQTELYSMATDATLFKRRFRMLSQLAEYESQIYKKIYQFQGDTIDDYTTAVGTILAEIQYITNRNG